MSQRAVEIDDRETIVVGGTIAAVILATAYCLARIGFESHTATALRSLGLSLFILAIPYWLWRAFRRRDFDFSWSRSQPFFTLVTIAVTAIVALAAGPFASGVGVAGSVIGSIAAAIVLFSWLRNGAFTSRILFTLGAGTLSLWACGVVWTSRYKMPLYWEVFYTSANVHHDPLYVAAMGNMLRTYGVPSTGSDGIPVVLYHWGSPWLFSRWADLVDTDLLSFYSLGYALLLVPLFFASIAMLALEARKASLLSRPQGWLRSNWWGGLALAVATIGVFPESALYAMAVWNAHVLISESYLAGLGVFLPAVATAIIAWRAERRSIVFLFGFLPVILAALAFLKVSLMIFMLGMVLYVLFRTRLLFSVVGAASAVVMFVAGYLAYEAVSLPQHNGGFVPFHFIRTSTASGWHQFFLLTHFAWTWIYVAGRIYEERIRDFGTLLAAIKGRSIVDVELLLLVTLLGFLPGAILSIHGGSAIYFSDLPRWLALALVIARAGHWVALWRQRRARPAGHRESRQLVTILAVFIAAPFAVTMLLNTVSPPIRMLRQNVAVRSELVVQAGRESGLAAGERGLMFDPNVLAAGLVRGKYYDVVTELRDAGRTSANLKQDMLLFIPQSYGLYWNMFDAHERCTYVSLVAPAISELAMIDGMPPYACKVTDQYNMSAYTTRVRDQLPGDVTDTALCVKAGAKGFSRVMVLAPDPQGAARRRVVECVT